MRRVRLVELYTVTAVPEPANAGPAGHQAGPDSASQDSAKESRP